MKSAPLPLHRRLRGGSVKSWSASVAAFAAAMLALESAPGLSAASGTWQAGAADSVTITVDSAAWKVAPFMREGDVVYIGATAGVGLGTTYSYYYVVGTGSTPSGFVRFGSSPSAGSFTLNNTNSPLPVGRMPAWMTAANWTGGVVPNGVDDQATIAPNANAQAIALDGDVTLGSLSVDTTAAATTGISLISTSRNAGPVSTLTFARSSGTPTLTVSGGNAFSLSEAKITGNTPSNANAKLVVVGEQGLVIDNQNSVGTPVAVNSSTAIPAVPLFAAGAVRFGYGLDWSKFSGDLTLARGVFQPLAGGSLNNNLSSLPLASKLVLGTGANVARLEVAGNGSSGPSSVRGLESTSPNSSIINTAGSGMLSFQVGSYGKAGDNYTFAGNIGDSTNIATLASVSGIRFVKIGAGTQTLSGVNNLNANSANQVLLAVNGGKLSLGTTGAIGTITGGQGAANADSSVVFHNGEFEISGVGLAGPRSQAFGGALLFGTVTSPTAGTADDKHASQSNSFSALTVAAGAGQPATLTFGSLRPRNYPSGAPTSVLNGVTMLFRGTNLGATPGAGVGSIFFTTAPTVGGGSLFANNGVGALGTAQAAVLKGALADTSPSGGGSGFATYDPVNGVRPLSSSEQTNVSDGPGYDASASADNVRLSPAADVSITGKLTNTLEIRNTGASARTVTSSGVDLNPANGLLFSGTAPIVLTGGQITGTASNNSEDVVIHTINSSSAGVTLRTPVSNVGIAGVNAAAHRQGWITFNGPGALRVEGALTVGNTGGVVFNGTGVTTVAAPITDASSFNFNQGLVKFDTGASWNGVPRLLVAPEAKVDLNGIGGNSTLNRFSDVNVTINPAGITLTSAGGEVTNSSSTPVDLYLSGTASGAGNQGTSTAFFGTITGNINLVVDKSTFVTANSTFTYGTQALANANTYTGVTRVLSGTLNLSRGGLLPKTTVVTLGTSSANSTLSSVNSTLSLGDSNGSTNGSIRQEIAGLYAVGTGTAAVINNGSNVSQLTLNIPAGTDNVFTGNLGITPSNTTNLSGNNQNLFALRKTGPGTFQAAGAVTAYTGGTVIEGGFLRVSADSFLGQIGSLTGTALTPDAPASPIGAFANSILLNGGALQASATFTLDSKRGIGLGPVSGATGGSGGIRVDTGATLTYAGVIASAGNTGAQTFAKSGAGALVLNGASTFAGSTQVLAGSLGGIGSLASGVTVESGAALSPGDGGVGTFTVGGALTLKGGSVLNVDLGAPGTSDLLQVNGAISSTGVTTVNLAGGAGFGVGSYTLISGSAPIAPANFAVGTIPSGFRGTFSSSGNNLVLNVAVGSQLSAIETWRNANFGASANSGDGADGADPDADGLVNLVEYATNTDPRVANSSVISVGRSGNFVTLTYTRVADATLTYTVEASNDLSAWSTVSTANNPSTGAQNLAGQVTVIDTAALTNRRFLRLKISY